jgi:hypothetical protein
MLEAQLLREGMLRISVEGTKYHIAEIAEQLAWLGSSMRAPRQQGRIYICHAELTSIPLEGNHTEDETSFSMQFHQTPLPMDGKSLSSSQCWKGLFRSLTIARGFPVSSRPEGCYGLDINIDIATKILGGWQINLSDSRLLFKNFGSILVPTKTYQDEKGEIRSIAWHLLEGQCGLYIPCAVDDSVDQIRSEHLRTVPNIVGWCERVENVTGT